VPENETPGGDVSHPPAAPVQYAHPAPPAAPPPPKKKKRGCCSCCLWVFLIFVLLSVSFVVAAQLIMRTPANPVKEEYESIPDYFSRLDPEILDHQYGTQELRKEGSNLQSPESRAPSLEPRNPQFAIRNPQWFGGAHV
jgi:hypothetical protein